MIVILHLYQLLYLGISKHLGEDWYDAALFLILSTYLYHLISTATPHPIYRRHKLGLCSGRSFVRGNSSRGAGKGARLNLYWRKRDNVLVVLLNCPSGSCPQIQAFFNLKEFGHREVGSWVQLIFHFCPLPSTRAPCVFSTTGHQLHFQPMAPLAMPLSRLLWRHRPPQREDGWD